MRRVSLIAGALLAALSGAAVAQSSPLHFSASIALQYGAHLSSEPPRTVQRGGQFNPKLEYDGGAFRVYSEGRVRWNDAYRSSAYSSAARDAYRLSADWRELYVAGDVSDWNLSAGLQQVVWGKADNLRVVDIVNPVDLRYFILPELNDYRIPVMTVRGTRAVGDWQIELLYLPRFVPTRFARSGSEFDLQQVDPQLLVAGPLLPEDRPSKSLKDGEFGMQASRSFGALDWSGYVFHTWNDSPVYRFLPDAGFMPTYRRQSMIGMSMAHAVGNGLVLRSEWAYVPNQTEMVTAGSADGLTRSAMLTGLLGGDYVWRDWMFTVQITDRYMAAWNSAYLLRKHDPMYTLAATGTSMAGKLDTRLSLARFVADGGYVAQARATWKPHDAFAYSVGMDVFGGESTGIFGRFRHKDRLWIELKHYF